MKVLITGGNGFVGINIVNEIIQNTDWQIVCLIHKNSHRIPTSIEKVYELNDNMTFDVIIHAGGDPSSKSCINNPENALGNIVNTFNILEFARRTNVKKMIFFSSCEVYGFATDTSCETDMLYSYNMYGASKVSCEHMCSSYFHTYNISIVAIRLLNTYGPYCQEERFPSIINKKFENEEVPHFILSNKTSKRWLSITEMAKRTIFIIKNMPIGFETFNFVGDENLNLVEFINKISGNKKFTYEYKKEEINGYHHEGNADGEKFKIFRNKINNKIKNILIYAHMPYFKYNDGGTVVQYNLAKTLEEYGLNVRIFSWSNIKIENSIFNKYYENDYPIDDNCIVIYCEGTKGNPLNAKYCVRWMLSKLGLNVPEDWLGTWGKNELVYYFNSEEKIQNNPDKLGNVFKLLPYIYVSPYIKNNNKEKRSGACYTIRKGHNIHKKYIEQLHPPPPNSFEINRSHQLLDCVNIFNNFEYFYSYDTISFLPMISAMCGCISIVVKVDGLNKEDWLNTLAPIEYLKETGEPLYGVAYGEEEIEFAKSTLHLVEEQWVNINKFFKKKYLESFINDINNFENQINTLENNFYK